MSSQNVLVILLAILFLIEISNQYMQIRTIREIRRVEEKVSQILEPPLPDFEEEKNYDSK